MDYIESFQTLKPLKKYARKSPEKAVLLLSVIELYDEGILSENSIRYDNNLTNMFSKVWKRLLPNDSMFTPDLTIPYWAMMYEDFWHVIPQRGKDDVVDGIKEMQTSPSESTIKDCVNYVELDDDLYFLMTLSSGRKSLKEVLLNTYFDLSAETVSALSESKDTYRKDYDIAETLIAELHNNTPEISPNTKDDLAEYISDDDVRYTFYINYYTFLKKYPAMRASFQDIIACPIDAYKHIIANDILDIAGSSQSCIADYLDDLRISLMSENNSISLIDSIDKCIRSYENIEENKSSENVEYWVDSVHEQEYISSENSAQIVWNDRDDRKLIFYFSSGIDAKSIASFMDKSEDFITQKLFDLGLIETEVFTSEEKDNEEEQKNSCIGDDFFIENKSYRCAIYNKENQKIYSSTGKILLFNNIPYRIAHSYSRLSVNILDREDTGDFTTGERIINAVADSSLYQALDNYNYIDSIKNIQFDENLCGYKLRIDDSWYSSDGSIIEVVESTHIKTTSLEYDSYEDESVLSAEADDDWEETFSYEPKGKISKIENSSNSPYDFLWTMAIIDLVFSTNKNTSFSFDILSCMMIANAWDLMQRYPSIKETENTLRECVQFLIDESRTEMNTELSWDSTKMEVFDAIKDHPMSGIFEDTIDQLVETAPLTVLKTWFKEESDIDAIMGSINFVKPCLYAIHYRKVEPFIVVNPKWVNNLYHEHDNLMKYFTIRFKNALK